jgi:two-component system NtrC family sensor kinase
MGKMITLPLLSFRKDLHENSILFIEHELQDTSSEKLINYLTSRIQILSIAVDRILSREKLEFESQKWEDTYDSLQEPLCILDDHGIVIRSNDSYDTEIQHIYGDELQTLSQAGLLNIRRGSKIYDAHFYKINFENSSSHAIVYFRDITQERLLYQSLVQTEKMSALGLLAGNIAHELNNPLTGIRSLAQILIQEVKNPSYLSDLKEIEKATHRCQNVITELQEFSAKGDIDKRERVDLHKLIHKTLTFLKTALRSHNLELDFQDDVCEVLASPQILQQIIFNIIINACQAMENSGSIEIRTQVVKPMVKIDIQDTGPGISTAAKPFVFDPFFTTKKEGEGTGIGLSFL